jgi:pilus assembly protein CpaE
MTDASGGKIRLLIVDDDAEMRENLKKLMSLETDIDVIGVAMGGVEGVQLAAELKPDVITMDINMQDMDGLTASRNILAANKRVAIIMLSVQHDLQYYREAMQAGACDFLSKPPESDELFNAIRRCYQSLPSEAEVAAPEPRQQFSPLGRTGHVVTVYAPKGGVGTTTVATSLAVGMARRGGQVIMVDADLQFGDVGTFLNVRLPNSISDLTEAGDELDPEAVDLVLGNHDSGARVLVAPRRPEMADYVVADRVGDLLNYLKQSSEYVIVDTGTVVNDALLAVLDATDRLAIVTTPDIPALKSVVLFYDLLELLDFDMDRTWLIINRLVKGSSITAERVEQRLSRTVVGQIFDDPESALQAVNAGEALVNSDPNRAPSVRGLIDLVKFVEKEIAAELEEDDGTGDSMGPKLTTLFPSS